MRRTLVPLIAAAIIVPLAYRQVRAVREVKEAVPTAIDFRELDPPAPPPPSSAPSPIPSAAPTSVPPSSVPVPAALNLKAAFHPQAPHANWDLPWQEACEEASILLAANAYKRHGWDADAFNAEILKLVAWEKKRFGSYEHTNVEETAATIEEYLGLKTVIHEDPTYEDVQRILAKGHFIVMTFAGKELGNPYYSNGGPPYHAMLVKGYKGGRKLIVHDVGTKRGADYVYPWTTIHAALHDYAEPVSEGAKRMIEILPPA